MIPKKILIWGVGPGAETMTARLAGAHEVVAYVVDDECLRETSFLGRPCLPFSRVAAGDCLGADGFFCSVGYRDLNRIRTDRVGRMRALGLEAVSWISPHAAVEAGVTVGAGCQVGAGCVIDARAVLGDAVVVLPGALVGHDSVIEEGAWICQGANIPGFVRVGSRTFVGTGAVFSDGVTLGEGCFVKAGACVFRSFPANTLIGRSGVEEGRADACFRAWFEERTRHYGGRSAEGADSGTGGGGCPSAC